MSCDGLTLGKIIFGYTPRVVLPPHQPVLNATMNRYRDGEKTFPTMGWMQFRHIKKVKRFFVRLDSRQISNCGFLFEQSYLNKVCRINELSRGSVLGLKFSQTTSAQNVP